MMHHPRILGHFKKSSVIALYKYIEILNVKANSLLFKPGDKDDSIYIIEKGRLSLSIRSPDGVEFFVKEIFAGESVFSMLSVIDVLTGHPAPLKTVTAKAEIDSVIIRLPARAFGDVFLSERKTAVRLIRVMLVAIHRVTLCTLHSYLGLTKEIMKIEALMEEVIGRFKLKTYPPGYILRHEGATEGVLYIVVTGSICILQRSLENEFNLVSRALPGQIAGGLKVLTNQPSPYTLMTKSHVRVIEIKKPDLFYLIKLKPKIVLIVANSFIRRLSPFIRSIDFALSLKVCDPGRTLYRQKEKSDALYVVLHGRLRSLNPKTHVMEEYCRGDIVGMAEVFSKEPRSSTVIAVRPTELSNLPEGLLNYIKHRYPTVLSQLIKLLGASVVKQKGRKTNSLSRFSNLNTIAITAISPDVPIDIFTYELHRCVSTLGTTSHLSSTSILRRCGRTSLKRHNESHLMAWLNQNEEKYQFVLYECDFEKTRWTRNCIRQADCILVVGLGTNKPSVGFVEKDFDRSVRAQKSLVLLWPEETSSPSGTNEWLKIPHFEKNSWCHIKLTNEVIGRFRNRAAPSPGQSMCMADSQNGDLVDVMSDFSRLSRILAGKAVGVVFGGGGAKGAAHIGIMKAMREVAIPIDIVGGVSMGSFIGALLCKFRILERIMAKTKTFFDDMCSKLMFIMDLTYNASARFTGAGFNASLQKALGESKIEDLWVQYFTLTTDLTMSEMRVHHTGSLWRYCRGSMTLAGWLPPMCDPRDGHLLVDGGYVNNLPADVMKELGVGTLIAIDVGSQDTRDLTNYGDKMSGFWVLYRNMNPFGTPVKECGYKYGKKVFSQWKTQGILDKIGFEKVEKEETREDHQQLFKVIYINQEIHFLVCST
uniref:Uncharacterized protein n=1 Tax=Romanomermis culicivorax TaxID=13658 RepID=A0A915J0C8_ROMCU